MAKVGRPTKYTQELADTICEQLALGYSLRTGCKGDGIPDVKTIFSWFRAHPEFIQQYARAKQESADAMAEDIVDISDEPIEFLADGKANNAAVQRNRLRVDTRKWLMAKMKPKKYGEKLDITTDGEKLQAGAIMGYVLPSDVSDIDESSQKTTTT